MSWPEWRVAEVMTARPRARVNQLGYLIGRPKQAKLMSDAEVPVHFTVRDRDGLSRPWSIRPEPTSGLNLHVLDFTALNKQGAGFRIEADEQGSHPFKITNRLYEQLAADALRFFLRERSGVPILDSVVPGYGRPAGHLGRPPNRGDLAVAAWTGPEAQQIYPEWHCEGTFDVSGGWYDAGDYGKYVTSGAIAAWQLLSTLDLLKRVGHTAVSELPDLIRAECRWQLDWLLRMQVPAGDPLAEMAFTGCTARNGHRSRVGHTRTQPRGCCIGLRRRQACTWPLLPLRVLGCSVPAIPLTPEPCWTRPAPRTRRRYVIPQLIAPDDHAQFGGGPYSDDRLEDDFYWAAAELWLAAGEDVYRQQIASCAEQAADAFDPRGYDFDRVTAPARLDLALVGSDLADHEQVVESVRRAADRLVELQRQQPWGQPYAPPEGWDWGQTAGFSTISSGWRWRSCCQVFPAIQMQSPPAWTICLGGTLSVRATSPDTAPTTAVTSELDSLVMISIRRCHRHHRARWLVGRTPGRPQTSLTILDFWAFHLSAATSMSPPPRSPTTSVSAGMRLSFGSPSI